MNMQDIQLLILDQIHHHNGQSEIVRRKLEQRIGAQVHLMVGYIGLKSIQTGRTSIAQDVDFMAVLGQSLGQFSGNDSATAESWIADNTDIHIRLYLMVQISVEADSYILTS